MSPDERDNKQRTCGDTNTLVLLWTHSVMSMQVSAGHRDHKTGQQLIMVIKHDQMCVVVPVDFHMMAVLSFLHRHVPAPIY